MTQPAPSAAHISPAQSDSSSADSQSIHESHSRPSTPPTEISSTLSSPTFAPPVETEDTIRRRQQSDQASSEIGKRLLKGWAMLGEECPNIRCYGIPLVRPPRTAEQKDPRKVSHSEWFFIRINGSFGSGMRNLRNRLCHRYFRGMATPCSCSSYHRIRTQLRGQQLCVRSSKYFKLSRERQGSNG